MVAAGRAVVVGRTNALGRTARTVPRDRRTPYSVESGRSLLPHGERSPDRRGGWRRAGVRSDGAGRRRLGGGGVDGSSSLGDRPTPPAGSWLLGGGADDREGEHEGCSVEYREGRRDRLPSAMHDHRRHRRGQARGPEGHEASRAPGSRARRSCPSRSRARAPPTGSRAVAGGAPSSAGPAAARAAGLRPPSDRASPGLWESADSPRCRRARRRACRRPGSSRRRSTGRSTRWPGDPRSARRPFACDERRRPVPCPSPSHARRAEAHVAARTPAPRAAPS
jgi:hypothetical protein